MKLNLKNLLFINLLGILIFCTACKEKHYYITIVSNSNELILCQWTEYVTLFSDTLFDCTDLAREISPQEQWEIHAPKGGDWVKYLNSCLYAQFIIVSDSIYENIPCDTISKYNMVLHRYQLRLEDLQRMDWKVYYPPE